MSIDEKRRVKVVIPFRRDLLIPLKPDESRRLVEKLNELIPKEKARAAREAMESEKRRKTLEL